MLDSGRVERSPIAKRAFVPPTSATSAVRGGTAEAIHGHGKNLARASSPLLRWSKAHNATNASSGPAQEGASEPGVLTIKGEKKQSKEEKTENYYVTERSYGAFERSLRLPDSIDETKIEAKFDKGVLKVTAAKKPEAVKAERKIEIKKAS